MEYISTWHLADDPIAEPFYLLRDFDERSLPESFLDWKRPPDTSLEEATEEFVQCIYHVVNFAAKSTVDEVVPGAKYEFFVPDVPDWVSDQWFTIPSPHGPIVLSYVENRMNWHITAYAAVKVTDIHAR